jgi:hypothetical protein
MYSMEKFHIRAYGKSELAQCYSPDISVSAARRKLMRWIDFHPTLVASLTAQGFTDKIRTFSPAQVQLIVDALGEP